MIPTTWFGMTAADSQAMGSPVTYVKWIVDIAKEAGYIADATGVLSVNTFTGDVILTTDEISEGSTNLYFTSTRALAALTGQNISIFTNDAGYLTDAPSDGSTYGRNNGAWVVAGAGSATWGGITGTLSSQTDLQTALNAKQPLDSDLTIIAALAPANDDVIQRKAGVWTNRTLAQLKTDLSLQPLDADLTAIAALGFTSTAFLKKTAANTWALDTNTYLTSFSESDPVFTSWLAIPPSISGFANDAGYVTGNIYTTDDQLTGDRVLDLAAYRLQFINGGSRHLDIDVAGQFYGFGDIEVAAGGTRIIIEDNNQLINIGAPAGLYYNSNPLDTTGGLATWDGVTGLPVSTFSNDAGYLFGIAGLVTLSNAKIWIGNGSNVATEVSVSGDFTIDNTGFGNITAGAILNADVNASAAIAHTKMAALTASSLMVTNGSGFASASAGTGFVKATAGVVSYDNSTYLTTSAAAAAYQPLDSDLTAIAAIAPSNDDIIQRKAGAWTNRTMAQLKTDLVLVKGDVGLGNVDNTSDANKPVSTAQATAIALKVDKSQAAYTFQANNTNATADMAALTYKSFTNLTYAGTATFTTGAAVPSGTPVIRYSWSQINKDVYFTLTCYYPTNGTSVTSVVFTFPSDMPAPTEPTGTGAADDVLYPCVGFMTTNYATAPTVAGIAYIKVNTADTGYEIRVAQGSHSNRYTTVSGNYKCV